MKNLSSPSELQAAIDGNRREGRRSGYDSYPHLFPPGPGGPLGLPPRPPQVPLPPSSMPLPQMSPLPPGLRPGMLNGGGGGGAGFPMLNSKLLQGVVSENVLFQALSLGSAFL